MFSQSRIAYLVLAMVICVILFYFASKWNSAVDDAASVEKCRISVERNARLKIGELRLGTELDCPVREISIGKNVKPEEAKEKIAREMYTCWKQFGRGKLDLFRENGVYCKVCSIIDLKTEENIDSFSEYLLTTPSPTKGLYYYDYLSSFETSRAEEIVGNSLPELNRDGEELIKDKTYAVIFVYAKGTDTWEKIKGQFKNGILQGASIITGIGVGSKAGGIAAGGAAAVSLLIPGVNVGVVAVVGGTVVAIATYAFIQKTAWDLTTDQPEWFAFNVLREWQSSDESKNALEDLNCEIVI